jgi:tRNA G10  N-methylase Trm11
MTYYTLFRFVRYTIERMIIALLGRQPELGFTELTRLYGREAVTMYGREAALVRTGDFDIQSVGGTVKAGRVLATVPGRGWPAVERAILRELTALCDDIDQKITLGISVYGTFRVQPRELQKLLLSVKRAQKALSRSVRIIPNQTLALNTAVSHHNKLGLSPHHIELLVVHNGSETTIATSVGAQNITALARRDQGRPARDAFVGMLPPKLALMMVNMGIGQNTGSHTVLDPFCGTGVVLQEALLRGYDVVGTDLSEKMVSYSLRNLDWLIQSHHVEGAVRSVAEGNATTHTWTLPIDAVVCETYLGQPFSATPSPSKLREVRGNCNHIVSEFLRNIHSQLQPGTPLCIAVPAWRDLKTGRVTRLPLVHELTTLGFTAETTQPLLYFREDQVVARDILLISNK